MATHALRAKRPEDAGRLHAFATTKAAADFLQPWLHDGDLVVLKGSMTADHLGRLAHHRLAPISCWRMDARIEEVVLALMEPWRKDIGRFVADVERGWETQIGRAHV